MIRFGPAICQSLSQARTREWIETNGLGGFASSTITGLNTRRYHGLLTAALQPPSGRVLLLSKVEETLVLGDSRYDLGVNEYPGTVHPLGNEHLTEFRLDPYPVWTWRFGDAELEKRLFLVHGEDTVVITWTLRGGSEPARLELRPLIAFRDYHSTTHNNNGINRNFAYEPGRVTIAPYQGLPPLHFAHHGEVHRTGDWYFMFQYAAERERGLDAEEDLFQPFRIEYDLSASPDATLIASTRPRSAADAEPLRLQEEQRRAELIRGIGDPFAAALTLAADQFIVRRGEGHSIIAGYPWFTDWGRDTMIALPGLTLSTGRFDVARGILAAFAGHIDQGMLPNRFPDAGETPEYNTVDATLWFFEAIRAYLEATGDEAFVRDGLFGKLKDIIEWHLRGTRYGIVVDTDGLLRCGEPGVQLTWMDAKVGDWVVTPRSGKPVEIQALWYNALRILEDLARRFDDPAFRAMLQEKAALAHDSFRRQFWNEQTGWLNDVVDAEPDATLRPNQILAVSLHYPLLEGERARQVVEVVRRELLTPIGLRTLPTWDPSYRPRYQGGVWERDSAYHQGTIWPWLLGPFFDAWRRTGGDPAFIREHLGGMQSHLCEGGLGQISEIADADPPHAPRGCFAQAWSVAEVLRAVYSG